MKFTLCKKQYLYIALAIISIVLAITTRAFAEEVTPTEQRGTAQTESSQADGAPRVEGQKSALEVAVQDRIVNLTQNVTGKMRAAVNRMDQIIGRIDARVVILKGQNIDTSAIEEAVQSAKNSLAFAKNKLPLVDAFVIEQVSSENPIEAFKKIRSEFSAIRDAIRNTHNILVYVVSLLKDAGNANQNTENQDMGSASTTN